MVEKSRLASKLGMALAEAYPEHQVARLQERSDELDSLYEYLRGKSARVGGNGILYR